MGIDTLEKISSVLGAIGMVCGFLTPMLDKKAKDARIKEMIAKGIEEALKKRGR